MGFISIKWILGRYIKLSVKTDGRIVVSTPRYSSMSDVVDFIASHKTKIASRLSQYAEAKYDNNSKIGQHHKLVVLESVRPSVVIDNVNLIVKLPAKFSKAQRQQFIRQGIAKCLRKEAEEYLPKRLRYFALKYDIKYDRVRLTHAKTRWGSCSTSGTISLNIALMNLPTELIDYVLLHELNHVNHMNHSADFWRDLEIMCPGAKSLNKRLKSFSPFI